MIYVFRYAAMVVYTLFWGGLICLTAAFDRSGEFAIGCARRWARWILWTCGIEVVCEGVDAIDPDQPCVLMSNHQSVIDVLAIVHTLPTSFRFVAKRELTWIPVFGWALWAGGHVIIDRHQHGRAVASLERGAAQIRRGGHSVIIFPEGTRSATGVLRPFKSGGFHLAMQAGVPIAPVSISGSMTITPRDSLRIQSGRVAIRYAPSIPTGNLAPKDRERLKEQVRLAILGGLSPDLQELNAGATRS